MPALKVSSTDNAGDTALHVACQANRCNLLLFIFDLVLLSFWLILYKAGMSPIAPNAGRREPNDKKPRDRLGSSPQRSRQRPP